MDTYEIARAQYSPRERRNDYQNSTRYAFDAPIVEHDGEYAHEVTVSSKSTGHVYHHSFETDPVMITEIFDEWWAQLEVRETSTAMWGH